MNIKKSIANLFTYTPNKSYVFSILEHEEKLDEDENINENIKYTKIENNYDNNLKHVQTSYNTLINSDIVIREFTLNARNQQYKAFLLYIDGMIDTNIMNDFVLKPLMLKNQSNSYAGEQTRIISETTSNNVTIRKVKKFDITEYLLNSLMPQNSVKTEEYFENVFTGVNSGNCALFVDTLNIAFNIEVKGFKQRSIDAPNNEVVIKGSQEAFVENIRTNTSILRRIINNENLIIENVEVGKITKTKCGICYMQNITNSDLVAEAKYRINNLGIDTLLSSGELEQLISEENELRHSRNNVNRKTR